MRNKILFTLQGYFARSDGLFSSPHIFVIVDKRSELSRYFLKRFQRSGGKLLFSSQAKSVSQHARTMPKALEGQCY